MYFTVQEAFLARTLTKTRYAARETRGLDFDIDLNYVYKLLLEQNGKCALTGWNLEFTRGGEKSRSNPMVCTIDRIDNSKGYIQGNIQLTCWVANKTKSTMSNSEFIDMCKDIAKKHA
jgi:hypothetical protein